MSASMIPVSVVIPTHNRARRLAATLEALERQTLDRALFEVVVVLSRVTDDTATVLASRDWPFNLSSVSVDGGAACARNAGAVASRGERIVFLDDDILVGPAFLDAHLKAADANAEVVVIGKSTPQIEREGWFERELKSWWSDRFEQLGSHGHRFAYTDFFSGNVSLSRVRFEQAGRFDETLACREDYEFGYRVLRSGAIFRYSAEACGLHFDGTTLRRSLRRAQSEGIADVRIAQLHPPLYRTMWLAKLAGRKRRFDRLLMFHMRPVGDALCSICLTLMPVFESLGARVSWRRCMRFVRHYSYFRGVAMQCGNLRAFRALSVACSAATREPLSYLEVDALNDGDTWKMQLQRTGVDGVRINYAGIPITIAEASPGMERPTLDHIEALWRESAALWAPLSLAARSLPPLPATALFQDSLAHHDRFEPIELAEVDVSDWSIKPPLERLPVQLRLLVRDGRRPLGWLELDAGLSPVTGWKDIRERLLANPWLCHELSARQLFSEPVAVVATPPISVVICTRDRTEQLRTCLDTIRHLDYPDFEVVVIDNAPTTDATERLVRELPGVRYVREDRPGLDWARNRGIDEAMHELITFTDDDTFVDKHWLTALAEAFAEPAVEAVTGLVVPKYLDTHARVYFEDIYGGMGKGFEPQWYRQCMLWSSRCGVGANMAFRRSVFDRAGRFDPALDVGTVTRGGGD
ncbi:MAG: glycosyltransferase, partial [Burkholderiales bacterium]